MKDKHEGQKNVVENGVALTLVVCAAFVSPCIVYGFMKRNTVGPAVRLIFNERLAIGIGWTSHHQPLLIIRIGENTVHGNDMRTNLRI